MRELVALKASDDAYWDIVWCIHHSQGFNYTDPNDVIAKIKEVWPEVADCEYEVVNNEIYFIDCNIDTVNPG